MARIKHYNDAEFDGVPTYEEILTEAHKLKSALEKIRFEERPGTFAYQTSKQAIEDCKWI